MVLNSLAILFLNELDDNLATNKDYRLAKDVVERFGWLEKESVAAINEKEEEEPVKDLERQALVTEKEEVEVANTQEEERTRQSSVDVWDARISYSGHILHS